MAKKTTKRKQKSSLFWKKVGMFTTIFLIFLVIGTALLGVKSLIDLDSLFTTAQEQKDEVGESLVIKEYLTLVQNQPLSVQVSVYNTANTHAQNVQFFLSNCSTDNISISSSMIESITPRESKVGEVVLESSAQAGEYTCTFEAKKDPFAQTIVTQNITIQVIEE